MSTSCSSNFSISTRNRLLLKPWIVYGALVLKIVEVKEEEANDA